MPKITSLTTDWSYRYSFPATLVPESQDDTGNAIRPGWNVRPLWKEPEPEVYSHGIDPELQEELEAWRDASIETLENLEDSLE